MKRKYGIRRISCWAGFAALAFHPFLVEGTGILTPQGSVDQPIELATYKVQVVINNGFARTEVEQVFYNPNETELEAVYVAPVPENGALSELTIWAGERVLRGEVVSKDEADRIYVEEKNSGNDVGKASQESYQRFEFTVYPVPAKDVVQMRYVYYEPLPIDTGIGRYVYRLEEGGTDEDAQAFWTLGDIVTTDLSIDVTLKSTWPIAKIRIPDFDGTVDAIDERTLRYSYSSQGGQLNQDFVFYYMLEENLPGRLELLTYRENEDKPGTFMMIMTPGADLRPLENGSDFVFALDVSGSMQGKLPTLIAGVKKALGQLKSADRFRIVAFNNVAWDITRDWIHATQENVKGTIELVDRLQANGGTNVYDGIRKGMARMDADRVSSLILVTDGVANQGIVDPVAFYKLLHGQDARFFGFLLGNSSNWPLMRLVCDASGGHYRALSNSDDIIGEILIARNKVAFESMHRAKLSIEGVKTFDVSGFRLGKIHYGDQLVLFGRYENGGPATVKLTARISGEDRVYETNIAFPNTDQAHPELVRLWALDQIQKIELNAMAGFANPDEAKQSIRDLGIAFQIVTDETSMIALDDEAFARHGLERRNQSRIARERAAAQVNPNSRGAQRVDTNKPMYQKRSHSLGGGAIEPWLFLIVLAGGSIYWILIRRSKPFRNLAPALAVGIGTLGFVGSCDLRAENELRGHRWMEREHDLGRNSSSIDRSIASFWEVSEAEARVDRPRIQNRKETQSDRYASRKKAQATDAQQLYQRRDNNGTSGHIGINLFNAIPIIDLVWGEKRRSESDEYSGNLDR